MNNNTYPRLLAGIAALALLAASFAACRQQGLLAFLLDLVGTLALFAWFGQIVSGRYLGMLIDSRNVMSLARFQTVAWTAIVFSALLAAAMLNMGVDSNAALDVALPEPLLWAMGITTTSLVGSPLILSGKKNAIRDVGLTDAALNKVAAQTGMNRDAMGAQGTLYINHDPRSARWRDLLTGEEISNAGHIDVSRVQMLYISVLLLVVYAVMIGLQFRHATSLITALPDLSQYMVGLLTISQGGYLLGKAVAHTPTA